jgi:hypothetical protein
MWENNLFLSREPRKKHSLTLMGLQAPVGLLLRNGF